MIDYVKQEKEFKLDLSKLIMAGFSFGGLTAIEASKRFSSDIKYCITYDPWFHPVADELIQNKYCLTTVPFLLITTEISSNTSKGPYMAFHKQFT